MRWTTPKTARPRYPLHPAPWSGREAASRRLPTSVALIFDGQLREGMRLPQDAVAKAVGVSRIPIREAIIALERVGWVTTKLHRGTFVNAFDEQIIRDHYELFGLVYGLAARRAAQRQDPETAAKLAELVKQMRETDDLVRIEELAFAFHSTVVEAARSLASPSCSEPCHVLVPGPFCVLVPQAVDPSRRASPPSSRPSRTGR